MITITAEFDKGQLKKLLTRLNLVQKAVHYYIDSPAQLPRKLALAYVSQVRGWIVSQRGMSSYRGYNEKYEEWKERRGKFSGYWRLYGDLFANLSVFSKGRDWFGGVNYYAMDTGNKSWHGEGNKGKPKRIAMYGTIMEEGIRFSKNGSGVHPARPLFTPVLKDFVSSKSAVQRGGAWYICERMLGIVGDYWTSGIARRTL